MNCFKKELILFLSVFFVIIIFCGSATAATIKVNNSTPNAISNAVNTAESGDTIYLSAGNYYEHDLKITKSLTISGPLTTDAPSAIIDADQLGRIFYINSGINVNLKYVQIQNGYIGNDIYKSYGGAIRNLGNLNIKNCQITQNTAYMGGGGIYNSGTCTINYSVIYINSAENDSGGGIYNRGTCNIIGSSICYNTIEAGGGGGIWNCGKCTINGSFINDNYGDVGGGINNSGNCSLSGSALFRNIATFNSGGAIRNSDTCIINGCNIFENSAKYGGGIYDFGNSLKISMCDFKDNQATSKEGNAICSNSIFNYGTIIRYCRFNDNYDGYEIYSQAVNLDMQYNWWGSNSNPSSKVYGKVNYGSWIQDITGAPKVSSSTPKNGSTKIARNQTITINFNEYLRAGYNFDIELKTTSGKIISLSKSISGKTLTIKPSIKLAANTKYIIYLHSGCLTDYNDNKMTAKTISFTAGAI